MAVLSQLALNTTSQFTPESMILFNQKNTLESTVSIGWQEKRNSKQTSRNEMKGRQDDTFLTLVHDSL